MKRFLVAALAATTGAAMFAIFFNAISLGLGGQMQIGYDYDSCMNASIGAGLLLSVALAVSGALKKEAGNFRLIATGIAYGALFYLGVSHAQAGAFSWEGLAVYVAGAGFASSYIALSLWSFFAELPKS